ncbi:hypothetical protein [Nocardia sp. NPDC060249]|uniref:hypothetical protein n=1 Tax=Nocardia sp. NPDC060249 TaxID=3347082 RepID=UPI00364B2BC7
MGGGLVVVGDVVVGAAGVVDAAGDRDVVVGLVGIVVVVVLVGAVVVAVGTVVVVVGTVVVEVTVLADGSADTVTVLGSAVTVIVDGLVGVMVTVTVDTEVEATAPGSCTPDVSWIERLAVAEKLALTETTVEFGAETSVVVSDAAAVLVESGSGGAGSASVAV